MPSAFIHMEEEEEEDDDDDNEWKGRLDNVVAQTRNKPIDWTCVCVGNTFDRQGTSPQTKESATTRNVRTFLSVHARG